MAVANAASAAAPASFVEPIMSKYHLIDATTPDVTSGYSLNVEVGCADNYVTPTTLREVHLKLKLTTKDPVNLKDFYFGVLFNPSSPSAESSSGGHRMLAGTAAASSEPAEAVVLDDCLEDTTAGKRWDGVVVSYPYTTVVNGSVHYTAKDLWFLGETPDTKGQGAKEDYLSRDCNSYDWKVKDDKSMVHCDSETSECHFTVWLYRTLDTHNSQDYALEAATPELFHMVGFYNTYNSVNQVAYTVKAQGPQITIVMGAL